MAELFRTGKDLGPTARSDTALQQMAGMKQDNTEKSNGERSSNA